MKHIKKINEMSGENIFTNKRVIDVTDISDESIQKMLYDSPFGNGNNNSYFKFHVCDQLKHISKAKDPSNVVRFPKHNPDYVYEKGDDPISDYFMENGAKLGEELIILINW